jgi:hypothetical protein
LVLVVVLVMLMRRRSHSGATGVAYRPRKWGATYFADRQARRKPPLIT